MVTVITGPAPENEVPSIEVQSYRSPLDPSVTISVVRAHEFDGRALKITTIVDRQAMQHQEAITLAKKYAEQVGWTKVYAENRA